MIVLRTPKGWTGPKVVDGKTVEGTWRSHQVPLAEHGDNPEHLQLLETWMRSYRPEELFDANGRLDAASSPRWRRRASGAWAPTRTPTAGCCCEDLRCRTSATTRSTSRARAPWIAEATRVLGSSCATS